VIYHGVLEFEAPVNVSDNYKQHCSYKTWLYAGISHVSCIGNDTGGDNQQGSHGFVKARIVCVARVVTPQRLYAEPFCNNCDNRRYARDDIVRPLWRHKETDRNVQSVRACLTAQFLAQKVCCIVTNVNRSKVKSAQECTAALVKSGYMLETPENLVLRNVFGKCMELW